MFKLFIAKYDLGADADPEHMSNQFFDKLLPVVESEPLEPMPGLPELIHKLKENGIQLALASSSRRSKIDIVLRKLDLDSAFDAIVSGEDEIQHGKPAPDIFLEAARKLGKQPSECMAFEDAKNGVASINAARMFSIGIHNQVSEQNLGLRQNLSEANLQVNSLAELTYR
jgi:HAD superfamily hydrolase (TIGR01509 family)